MGVVDDVHRDFEGVFGVDAGARRAPAHRKHGADLDDLVLGRGAARESDRGRGGADEPEKWLKSHLTVSEKTYPRRQAR